MSRGNTRGEPVTVLGLRSEMARYKKRVSQREVKIREGLGITGERDEKIKYSCAALVRGVKKCCEGYSRRSDLKAGGEER